MPIVSKIIKRGLTLGAKFEQRTAHISPIQYQKRTLRRLLRKAQNTTFGQYYNFKEIAKSESMIEQYQANVPIFDYDLMHDKWWYLSLKEVENVSWKGHVNYFALSSGTSGSPSKRLPVTEDMLRAMRRGAFRMFFALNNFDLNPDLLTKQALMLGGSSDLLNQGGYYMGDLSGINASKPPFWLRSYYRPGTEISKINDWDARIEQISKEAPNWDIGFLVGIPSWLQLMMERIIDYHQLDTIHDIWPNLSVCLHGGIHFEPHKKSFESVLAHPLIYMDTYLASEGFVAYQNRPETRSMKMMLANGIFFEFVPFVDANFGEDGLPLPGVKALNIEEVEEGVDYALLLSTCSGAWRYLIGDTIRFTDKERSEIIITGRTKHFLSICGEHLSIDNMNHGIQEVEEQLNISIREFTVSPVKTDNTYAHKWYLGVDEKVETKKIYSILDEKLKEVNDDYKTERKSLLRPPQIITLPAQLFYEYQKLSGKVGGQNKFPRVMKDEKFKNWEAFVASQLSV